uniref:Uncharacterized protein n=1 Tax=Chaetoceros debilis TaxID=122233 RepID=A0A7S3VCP5_9STRA
MRLGQTGTIASLPLLCPMMMMLGASRNGTFDIMLPTAFAFAPGGSIPVQPRVIQRAHTRSSGTASSPYVYNNPAGTNANTAMNKLRTLHLRSLDTERQEDFLTDNKDTEKSAQAELNQRSMLETRLQMDLAAKERKNGTASNNNNNISINEGPPIAEVQVEPKEENAPAGKGGAFFFSEAEAEAEEEKAEENTLEEQANAQVSDPDIESVPQADDENFQQQVEDLLDHVNDILKDDDVDVAVNEKDPENEIEVVPVEPEVKVASPTEMKKPDTGMVEAESSAKVEIITEKNSGVEMSKNEDFLKAVGGAAFEASRWLLSEIRVGAADALTASIPTDRRTVLIDKFKQWEEGKDMYKYKYKYGLNEGGPPIPILTEVQVEVETVEEENAEVNTVEEEKAEEHTLEEQATAQISDSDIESSVFAPQPKPEPEHKKFRQRVKDLFDHGNDILKDDDVEVEVDVVVNEKDPENEIEVIPVAPEVTVASPTEMKKPHTGMEEAEAESTRSAKVEIITEKNSRVELSKNEEFLKALGGAAFDFSRWLLLEIQVGAAEALTASIPTDRRTVLIDKWRGKYKYKYGLAADDDNGLSERENNILLDRGSSMLKEIAAALAERAEQSRLDVEMWEKEKEKKKLKLPKEVEAAANEKVVAELAALQERLERESTELEEKKLAVEVKVIDVSNLQKEIDAEKVASKEKKKAIEVKELELAAVEKQQKLDSDLNKVGEMKSTVEAHRTSTRKNKNKNKDIDLQSPIGEIEISSNGSSNVNDMKQVQTKNKKNHRNSKVLNRFRFSPRKSRTATDTKIKAKEKSIISSRNKNTTKAKLPVQVDKNVTESKSASASTAMVIDENSSLSNVNRARAMAMARVDANIDIPSPTDMNTDCSNTNHDTRIRSPRKGPARSPSSSPSPLSPSKSSPPSKSGSGSGLRLFMQKSKVKGKGKISILRQYQALEESKNIAASSLSPSLSAETAKQQTDLELERNSLEEMEKAVY